MFSMKKKIHEEDYNELVGPMNQVSKLDAMVWSGVSDLRELDDHQRRTVIAKTRKAKTSSKKHDRHMNKVVASHVDITKED